MAKSPPQNRYEQSNKSTAARVRQLMKLLFRSIGFGLINKGIRLFLPFTKLFVQAPL